MQRKTDTLLPGPQNHALSQLRLRYFTMLSLISYCRGIKEDQNSR